MKKIILLLPLVLLLMIVAFLVTQLQKPNGLSPSEDWRGKPFPEFRLPNLFDSHAQLTKESLPQEPFLLNVWGSWCSWCIKEFPQLLELQAKGVKIVGLTYADSPENARQALQQWNNPFSLVIDDFSQGFLAQTLQINSAPTTFLIDHKGIVRYQQKGYHDDFIQDFLPRLEALRKEME